MPENGRLPVRLKGVGDSLWVTIDPAVSAEELKTALKNPFEKLKKLAVNARVVIDPQNGGGRESDPLIEELGSYLKETFAVGEVRTAPEKADPPETSPLRETPADPLSDLRGDAMIIAGRVRSGQKIHAENHLVILGDVNPGAEVIAGGDIIILGGLRGTAVAGQPDNEEAVIIALDFRPTQIQIGGLAAASDPNDAGRGKFPEFAKIDGTRIVILDYVNENPFRRLAPPEKR